MDQSVPTHWIHVLGRIAAGVPLLAATNIEDGSVARIPDNLVNIKNDGSVLR